MGVRILPGKPNSVKAAFSAVEWQNVWILAYLSGNNLIIISQWSELIQTIYLDNDGVAVDIDENTGKIAVAAGNSVFIFYPNNTSLSSSIDIESLRWQLLISIPLRNSLPAQYVFWTSNDQLISLNEYFALYDIEESFTAKCTWSFKLASKVHNAALSYDANYIATAGEYDTLVKLWRRQSFDENNIDFDFTYLPHPYPITSLAWKSPFVKSEPCRNTLYSLSTDNVFRIWAPLDDSISLNFHLWFSLDLYSVFPPSLSLDTSSSCENIDSSLISNKRYACVMDYRTFAHAAEAATYKFAINKNQDQSEFMSNSKDFQNGSDIDNNSTRSKVENRIAQLSEVARSAPDVLLVFDSLGRFSAWNIENSGYKYPRLIRMFNIVHDQNTMDIFPQNTNIIRIATFGASSDLNSSRKKSFIKHQNILQNADINILIHDVSGKLCHYNANLDRLLDPGEEKRRYELSHVWTGHYKSIRRVSRTYNGSALITTSDFWENVVWYPKSVPLINHNDIKKKRLTESIDHNNYLTNSEKDETSFESKVTLDRACIGYMPSKVLRIVVLSSGNFIVTLHETNVILWSTNPENNSTLDGPKAESIDECPVFFSAQVSPLCFTIIPEASDTIYHIILINNDKSGILWRVDITEQSIKKITHFVLPDPDDILFIFPIDPVGQMRTVSSDFLDKFQVSVLTTISTTGVIKNWTCHIQNLSKVPNNKLNDEFIKVLNNSNSNLYWLQTSNFNTGLQNITNARSSSLNKTAVSDSNGRRLSIWSTFRENTSLEHEEIFPNSEGYYSEKIQDFDWTCTPDSQSILSVGFVSKILLYCQLRYDYTRELPAWIPFRQIDLRQYTLHPIGDSTWLQDGTFVVAAGNQIFIYDKWIPKKENKLVGVLGQRFADISEDIFSVVSVLNGPLVLYHPQFISQSIYIGKTNAVKKILVNLLKELQASERKKEEERLYFDDGLSNKNDDNNNPDASYLPSFNTTPFANTTKNPVDSTAQVSATLGMSVEDFTQIEGVDIIQDSSGNNINIRKEERAQLFAPISETSLVDNMDGNSKNLLTNDSTLDILSPSLVEHGFNDKVGKALCLILNRVSLPYLTGHQQITLASLIQCMTDLETHRRSIDSNGLRFLMSYRLFMVHPHTQPSMHFRDFNWALHSDSQESLLKILNVDSGNNGKILWPDARALGIFFWMKDQKLVLDIFETIARNAFTLTGGGNNPVPCTIYYLALKKKAVLYRLWRMAYGHKDQAKMLKFLANDFTERRWKVAAQKNAYALLSKHEFEYAAAFFLLGDSLSDAVNVCVRNLGDVHLAVAIARVYECSTENINLIDGNINSVGIVLQKLLEGQVIPMADKLGDRWMKSLTLFMLNRRTEAIKVLVDNNVFEESNKKNASDNLNSLSIASSLLTDTPSSATSLVDMNSTDGNEVEVKLLESKLNTPNSIVSDDPYVGSIQSFLTHIKLHDDEAIRKSFLVNDPVLSVLYQQLRLKSAEGRSVATNDEIDEFGFVMRTAHVYDRMGCDVLALDLVKNWKFIRSFVESKKSINYDGEVRGNETECSESKANVIEPKDNALDKNDDAFNNFMKKKQGSWKETPSATSILEPDMSAFDFGM